MSKQELYIIDHLFETSLRRIQSTDQTFVRSLMDEIQWEARLIGIKGVRGVGRTTLMLQHSQWLLSHCQAHEVIYLSLDNLRFTELNLLDVVRAFVLHGGRYLFLDEVHRYPKQPILSSTGNGCSKSAARGRAANNYLHLRQATFSQTIWK